MINKDYDDMLERRKIFKNELKKRSISSHTWNAVIMNIDWEYKVPSDYKKRLRTSNIEDVLNYIKALPKDFDTGEWRGFGKKATEQISNNIGRQLKNSRYYLSDKPRCLTCGKVL